MYEQFGATRCVLVGSLIGFPEFRDMIKARRESWLMVINEKVIQYIIGEALIITQRFIANRHSTVVGDLKDQCSILGLIPANYEISIVIVTDRFFRAMPLTTDPGNTLHPAR
jgi:hypothetical protein